MTTRLKGHPVHFINNVKYRKCVVCAEVKECKVHYRHRGHKYDITCKDCRSSTQATKRNEAQQILRIMKGAQCLVCNYYECQTALEFHHIDETTKLFNIGSRSVVTPEVISELNKTILLCGTCHNAVHSGAVDLTPYLKNIEQPVNRMVYPQTA